MKKITTLLQTEYILWFLVGCIVAGRFIISIIVEPRNITYKLYENYTETLIGILIALFPFVFYQIFGQYPLQSIKKRSDSPKILIQGDGNIVHMPSKGGATENLHGIEGSISLLTQLVINSEELSNKIYRRSGVYLIFGVFIAFIGILYFSFQSISIPEKQELTALMLGLLPRFGILFFIEFIAFFFLKQYRAAMDEFRHYDSIKRNRESQLAIYMIASKDFKETDFKKVLDKINFFDRVGVLAKGETTDLLEASKLNKNELNTIKDLISDLTKVVKNK